MIAWSCSSCESDCYRKKIWIMWLLTKMDSPVKYLGSSASWLGFEDTGPGEEVHLTFLVASIPQPHSFDWERQGGGADIEVDRPGIVYKVSSVTRPSHALVTHLYCHDRLLCAVRRRLVPGRVPRCRARGWPGVDAAPVAHGGSVWRADALVGRNVVR